MPITLSPCPTPPNQRPSTPPLVTYDQMIAQLRLPVSWEEEETYITDLVDACSEYAEQAMDSSLLLRTRTVIYDQADIIHVTGGFPSDYRCCNGSRYFLPRGPVLIGNVVSVLDANSQSLTFTQSTRGLADYVVLNPGQSYVAPLTITYNAGYGGDPSYVPADIKMAIRTHVATLYENRESISEARLMAVPQSLEAFYAIRRRTAPVA